MTLPAFAAERRAPAADIAGARRSQLSIDICCPCPRSAANQPHVAAAVDRRHRRTDGQTPDRYMGSERIIFKVATLTYRALHGSAPPCLASSFTCVADMPHRRRLRSASTEQPDVPTCRRSTIGGRAFPVAAAKVWNGLPSEVTSASSLSVFKNRLKTYLFRRCYETD